MSHPIVHAEIRSSDPDATRAFFGELFGWTYPTEGAFPGYTFVETGVPGLLLWVAVLTGLATTALRLRRFDDLAPWAAASAALAVALMVMSAADNIQGYTVVLVYPATLVGALVGAAARKEARATAGR